MKIFLLGLPGSGKTTIGRELARGLSTRFVDLDLEIEKREGRPIPEIFREMKEDYFRKVESAELKLWCDANASFVMATGGGAPCFFDNMDAINRAGKSIFLDVPASEIARRMARTKVENRPTIAAGKDSLKDHIEFMRSNRISYYSRATHTFTGTAISAGEILKIISSK